MTAFLESISAGDLGIFVEGEDFLAVQTMDETFNQSVTYRSAFGSDHPTIRTKRAADENTVAFSFLVLKSGVQRGLNSYQVLRAMEDFEIQTKKGDTVETYMGVNWTTIAISSTLDGVTVTVTCSIPGFVND